MKKGILIYTFVGKSMEEAFELASNAGFDGVELGIDETGDININTTKEDAQKIKALAEKYSIEIPSIMNGVCWTYSLTSDDKENRSMAMKYAKKQIEVASWLGCETVLMVPGAVKVDFAPNLGTVPYDVVYERALCAMRELSVYAEEHNICIAIENVWNNFLLSPIEMASFIDEIASEYVGAYFDAANMLNIGVPEQWVKILGKRIKKVHFKDFKLATNSFCPILCGDLNYPALMSALKEIGYDGWATAEVGAISPDYPEVLPYTTAFAMDKIIAGV